MFYEKTVDSFTKLMREVALLDSDAGVRIVGLSDGVPCFVFLSRTPNGYAAMVYEIKVGKEKSPGRRLESREFGTRTELRRFLERFTGDKVQAFVY